MFKLSFKPYIKSISRVDNRNREKLYYLDAWIQNCLRDWKIERAKRLVELRDWEIVWAKRFVELRDWEIVGANNIDKTQYLYC